MIIVQLALNAQLVVKKRFAAAVNVENLAQHTHVSVVLRDLRIMPRILENGGGIC